MSHVLKVLVFIFSINLMLIDSCLALSSSKHTQLKSHAQASQDQFVNVLLYELLDKQDEGYYLEIGSGHPSSGNNTYSFEKNYGWKGVSIDIAHEHQASWYASRQNPLLIQDATQTDYHAILHSFPQMIDYLSLDIDSGYDLVLQKIPFNEHIFKVITIEHDFYRFGELYREGERRILSALGYYLLCPDVSVFFNGRDCVFEDWWIHPSAFPEDLINALTSLDLRGKSHDQLINLIRSYYANRR